MAITLCYIQSPKGTNQQSTNTSSIIYNSRTTWRENSIRASWKGDVCIISTSARKRIIKVSKILQHGMTSFRCIVIVHSYWWDIKMDFNFGMWRISTIYAKHVQCVTRSWEKWNSCTFYAILKLTIHSPRNDPCWLLCKCLLLPYYVLFLISFQMQRQ